MKKIHKIKYKIIAIISIFIFLFPNINLADGEKKEWKVLGTTYYYTEEDDGSPGKDVKDVNWIIRGFTSEDLDSGENPMKFNVDKTYKWYTFNKNGTDWVVLRSMYAPKFARTEG